MLRGGGTIRPVHVNDRIYLRVIFATTTSTTTLLLLLVILYGR